MYIWIIEFCHFNQVYNYKGEWVTFYQLDQHYWWLTILMNVKCFVSNCNDCNWYKTFYQWKSDFLMPLPVSKKRFKHFTVDFIINLPLFINIYEKICINVMIIVNCFLKYVTFMSMWKINAVSVDCTWFMKFYWENGAPDSIVSDYDSQFVSNFWKQICLHININVKLLTVFHSETDNQTECINQFLKLYFWEWGNWLQTNWFWWVLMAQFAYNNLFHSAISITLFMAIKGFMPCSGIKVLYESEAVHTSNYN